jgi:hypothetical protein
MQVKEVISPAGKKEFHNFPKKLYKSDPNWICPLDSAVEAVFNPAVNIRFRFGEAIRWILKNEIGETIGRIAAFVDQKRSASNVRPTGGLGFFEVIEDKNAAFLLFDTAKAWLVARGMEVMDGPISFGENYEDWGLLVAGFSQQGYGMPYNKKYYKDFFEEYGFLNYFEQFTCHRAVRDADNKIVRFPDRIMKVAEWLIKRPGYTFRHFDYRESAKFINDICSIYNESWAYLKKDFTPIDPQVLFRALKKFKSFIDEEIIWFAYFDEKPIGFYVLVPDFNQILRHFNGKLHLWNQIRFLYYLLTHEMKRMEAIVGGVLHAHQNKGVEAAIFFKLYEVFEKKPWFKELEVGWVGDYNPKMIATYEALGAVKTKVHVTYRYLINKDLKFARYKDEIGE